MKTLKILLLSLIIGLALSVNAQYKLVIDNNGTPVTGQPMYQYLTDIHFQIPVLPTVLPFHSPKRPDCVQGSTPECVTAWDDYTLALQAESARYNTELAEQTQVINDFASYLQSYCSIATWTVVGKTWLGQKVRDWRILPVTPYSFKQAATRVLKVKTSDKLYFISFNKLN